MKTTKIFIINLKRRRTKRIKSLFKDIMAKSFLNLGEVLISRYRKLKGLK
jgi:hypothetical protein